jgi:hypothetical protein
MQIIRSLSHHRRTADFMTKFRHAVNRCSDNPRLKFGASISSPPGAQLFDDSVAFRLNSFRQPNEIDRCARLLVTVMLKKHTGAAIFIRNWKIIRGRISFFQ